MFYASFGIPLGLVMFNSIGKSFVYMIVLIPLILRHLKVGI